MPPREETPGPIAATQKPDSGSSKKWFWVSVSLATLWAMTLIAWYLGRRQAPRLRVPTQDNRDTTAADARRRFGDACRRNDARAARSSLLEWIGTSNAAGRPISLRAFARDADQPHLTRLLDNLDRACYAGGAWEGATLLAALNKLPASQPSNHRSREELEPLYK
jgi:hypothetical protein